MRGKAIGRRGAIAGGLSLLTARPATAGLPVPADGVLAFRLLRQGSVIGEHHLQFREAGEQLTVAIAVEAQVGLFGIPLVRYRHQAEEHWEAGRLAGLVATTRKNGDKEWAKAGREESALVVEGSQTRRYTAPKGALATSYWNPRMVDGPMISLEDGVLLRPRVAVFHDQTVRLASGASIAADCCQLRGAFAVDIWYDRSDTWAGLAFTVADGSTVHYERL